MLCAWLTILNLFAPHWGDKIQNNLLEIRSKKRKLKKIFRKEVKSYRNHIYSLKPQNPGIPGEYQFRLRFHFRAQTLNWLYKRMYLLSDRITLKMKRYWILELSIIDITLFRQMHLDLIVSLRKSSLIILNLTEVYNYDLWHYTYLKGDIWHYIYLKGDIWNFAKILQYFTQKSVWADGS